MISDGFRLPRRSFSTYFLSLRDYYDGDDGDGDDDDFYYFSRRHSFWNWKIGQKMIRGFILVNLAEVFPLEIQNWAGEEGVILTGID